MSVFTLREFARTTTIHALDREELSSRLYALTSWTGPECYRIAGALLEGRIISAPDFETLIVPGMVQIVQDSPLERRNWKPS